MCPAGVMKNNGKSKVKRTSMKLSLIVAAVLFPIVCHAEGSSTAASPSGISALKISAQEATAVIKLPKGKLRIVKAGDEFEIGEYDVRILEVAEGRLVMEEIKDKYTETVIFRNKGREWTVERIRKIGGEHPDMVLPKRSQKP
jgi:hypothetical protein